MSTDNHSDLERYLDRIRPILNITAGKKILEIAPLDGIHTKLCLEQNPKSITLVEANQECIDSYLNVFTESNVKIINDDIFFYLEKAKNFDIVLCCGLLYHLHSPFYLLELIANRVNPEYLIIESIYSSDPFIAEEERVNSIGQRNALSNWKTINLMFGLTLKSLKQAMSDLHYQLEEEFDYQDLQIENVLGGAKTNAIMTVWRKNIV